MPCPARLQNAEPGMLLIRAEVSYDRGPGRCCSLLGRRDLVFRWTSKARASRPTLVVRGPGGAGQGAGWHSSGHRDTICGRWGFSGVDRGGAEGDSERIVLRAEVLVALRIGLAAVGDPARAGGVDIISGIRHKAI